MVRILLRSGPNRNGNFTRIIISFGNDGGVHSVESAESAGRSANFEVPVSPSVIKETVARAKRLGIYKA